MRIVELIIDETENLSGVEAVSIVEFPAIESNFISLNQHLELAKVDDEKKILMGAALIPNKNIYRRNGDDEYYIFFSDETVRKASELFLMNSNQNNATLEHDKKLKDLSVVESWIVEDVNMDKSKKYGLNAPVGTWMVSMKVNNEAIWNDFVKTGKVKGFSIEGYFADKLEMSLNLNKKEMQKNVMIEKIKSLIEKSELKNQKVKLALIDDYYSSVQKAISTYVSADTKLKELKNYAKTIQDLFNNSGEQVLLANKIFDNVKKQAADLGIELPNELKNNNKDLFDYAKKIDVSIKFLNQIK